MRDIKEKDIRAMAHQFGYEYAAAMAVIETESSGSGFDASTGKIKIQFEPRYFMRYTGVKIDNKVDVQSEEWKAFNQAFKINKTAAMLATSWGLGQVMGFNHETLGFATVDAMVDDFKKGETEQAMGMLRFIKGTPQLDEAIREKDWAHFAYHYNGPGYKTNNYDRRMATAYAKYAAQ